MTVPEELEDVDLYMILGITKDAVDSEIKKAYRKKALTTHPDKASNPAEAEEFHKKFQTISFAYSILSDEKKKARYDKTGSLEDLDSDEDLAELFKDMYGSDTITKEMIEEDRKAYQGSQEEIDDVLAAYQEGKGDFTWVFESVPHAELDRDEQRIRDLINDQIEQGNAKKYKKFTQESEKSKASRRKGANKEAKEAVELAKELGIDKEGSDLALMIRNRQAKRGSSFLDNLEAKYGGGKAKGKSQDGPSEEDFERMAKRTTKPKTTKSKVKK